MFHMIWNMEREGILYNNSVCNVPYDMKYSLGNTTILTLDPDAMTFCSPKSI